MARGAAEGVVAATGNDEVIDADRRDGQSRPKRWVNSLTAWHTRRNRSRPGHVLDRWNHTRRTVGSTNAPTLKTSGRTLAN